MTFCAAPRIRPAGTILSRPPRSTIPAVQWTRVPLLGREVQLRLDDVAAADPLAGKPVLERSPLAGVDTSSVTSIVPRANENPGRTVYAARSRASRLTVHGRVRDDRARKPASRSLAKSCSGGSGNVRPPSNGCIGFSGCGRGPSGGILGATARSFPMLDIGTLLTHTEDLDVETFDWGTLQWLANGRLLPGAAQTLGLSEIKPGRRNPLPTTRIVKKSSTSSPAGAATSGHPIGTRAAGDDDPHPNRRRASLVNDGDVTLVCFIIFSSPNRQTVCLDESGDAS